MARTKMDLNKNDTCLKHQFLLITWTPFFKVELKRQFHSIYIRLATVYISSLVLFCSCNIDVIDLRILMKGATDALDFLQCLSIFRKRKPSLSPKGVP